jgi:hypothetical protein
MKDSRPASTALVASFFAHLEAEEDTTIVEQNIHQQIIGSFVASSLEDQSRYFDISFILTRFTSTPTKYCHMAVKRVIRYLQGTICLALEYGSRDIKMKVFVASDNAGDTNSRKSTSGMQLFLGSSLIQWHSKKQSAVSL